MPKKENLSTWRYKTEHVDLMLYQYCVGLEELSRVKGVTESDIETLNYLSAQRYTFLSETFKVSPSYKVKFILHSGHATIEKVPLTTIHDYITIE